jgi:mono/diheme cytochrome c family protein
MNRACLACILLAPLANATFADAETPPDQAFVDGTLKDFVGRFCADCHFGEAPEAGVDFDELPPATDFAKNRSRWMRVVGQLRGKGMPPADSEQPSDEARRDIADWIERAAEYVDCSAPPDPGRPTIRRLNRVEYNNTIRDLLGVDIRPADDFPSDDVGEGFDNIGDVLSVSPILIEKYLAAAEKIAAQAVVVPSQIKPMDLKVRAVLMRLRGGGETTDDGNRMRMSGRGELFRDVVFPARGEYSFTVRAYGEQAGPEPVRASLKVGRGESIPFEVPATRDEPGEYALVAQVDRGKHRVSFSFLNDYYQPDHPDPALRGDRNFVIESVRIQGPTRVIEESNPESHARIFFRPVRPETKSEDLRAVVERLAFRAFRRPPEESEVERLLALVELAERNGESVERGVQLALEAILSSPRFLFRIERDDPDDPAAVRRLDDFELATRLSYFLWSSTPDDELLEAAKAGALTSDQGELRRQVERMIASEKSDALVENFAGQWLQLRNLEDRRPDEDLFPEFSGGLRESMRRETELFFASILREGRSILELLDSDYTFVDDKLAKHYGLEGVEGNEFRRVSVAGSPRGGVLTHASILTVTSDPTRTSPVKRGKWILETLLGTPPPTAPPNVPELKTKGRNAIGTIRERMEEHRSNPACATCHEIMDPLGFGLENFNAIGAFRTRDGEVEIDASGALPDGSVFNGPKELSRILLNKRDLFTRNLTEKMLTYALGRGLDYRDQCVVRSIAGAVAGDDYRMSRLIWEVVRSDPFQKRRGVARGGE